jgi:hypothetical protein
MKNDVIHSICKNKSRKFDNIYTIGGGGGGVGAKSH